MIIFRRSPRVTPTPEADVLQSPVKQRHQPAVRGRGGTAAAAACPDSNFVTKASIDLAKRSCPDSKFVTKASTFVTKVSTLSPRRSTLPPRRSIAPVTSPVDVAIAVLISVVDVAIAVSISVVDVAIAVLISVVDALVDAMSSFLSACQWNVRGVVAGQKPSSTKSKRKVVEHLHVPFGGKSVLRLRLGRVTRAAVAAAWDLD